MRAEVVCPWVGTGAGATQAEGRRPKAADYPVLSSVDMSGGALPADPNVVSVVVVCDAATLEAITADAECAVLWSEDA